MKKISLFLFSLFLLCAVIGCKVQVTEHNHEFSKDWTNDAEFHWHKATCEHSNKVSDKSKHIRNKKDTSIVIKEPTCATKGSCTYNCFVCGKEITEEIEDLGWCENILDAETYEAANLTSQYVYFGVFPKTIKDSSVIVDELISVTMGANTYYKGSDGEWYLKVTANPFNTYNYSDGTITNRTIVYFKVEPIKWKVLTTDYNGTKKVLLVADEILTANVRYYINQGNRIIAGKTIYPNNYKYSTIRAYLNGRYEDDDTQNKTVYTDKGFLQTAFTPYAQALIVDTTVVNDGASTSDATGTYPKADGTVIKSSSAEGGDVVYYPDYTCANTIDKIFLLSEKEATMGSYGFDTYDTNSTNNNRIRITTDYAKANRAYQGPSEDYGGTWFLRSPGYVNINYVHCVDYNGDASIVRYVDINSISVVPALTLTLQ